MQVNNASMHHGDADIIKMLAIAHRRLMIYFSQDIQEIGVKKGHLMYIGCICEHPGLSQDQISNYLYVDKSTVAKVVKELLEEGYISRRPNPHHKREYTIMPTEKGWEVKRKIDPLLEKGQRFITRNMTSIESDLFRQLLIKLPLWHDSGPPGHDNSPAPIHQVKNGTVDYT